MSAVRPRIARARRTPRAAWLTASLLALAAFAAPAQEAPDVVASPMGCVGCGGGGGNLPPQVHLDSPDDGDQFIEGASVSLTATASDPDGSVASVMFSVDGTVLVDDTTAPYATTWTATGVGSHTINVRVYDNEGFLVHGSPVSITVVANQAPSVSLTEPDGGETYTVGATATFTATASDADGSVNRVEFLVDGTKVGQDTSSPYAYNWTATAGSHTVQARAVDNLGKTKTTSSAAIRGVPPVPTLTVPATNSTGSYSASWTASSGATHYELGERVGSGSWAVIQDSSARSKSLSGKTDGSYSYRVRACAGSGTGNCSAYSATGTTTVAIPPPAVPTLTVPATSSTGDYDASWTASSGATHYELGERVGSGSWVVIQDGSARSMSLGGKTDGSYSYRVRACKGAGTGNCSAYSTTGTVVVARPDALTRTYTYNAYQELCRVDEPETGATLMGYDGAGNLAWSASGLATGTACSSDGNTTAINARKAVRTYDARNRVSTLEFPDGNGNQSWTYTPDGLPDAVTTYNDGGASSVVNSYLYNKRRLPVSETQQVDSLTTTVGYGYDANGHLSTLTYPDSLAVAYAPNALGQPTQAGSYATGVSYYPNGAIAGFTYGNGIVHTLTQNARGLPDRSRDADGSTSIHDDSYIYDQVGNVAAIADGVSGNRGDRDMSYDDLNRLTSATSPMFGTASYAYDVLDNLTHVTVTGGPKARDQAYVYDEHNRLTNIMEGVDGVVGLGYDDQGNLNNKNGTLYAFDYGNRLREVIGFETYRYDVQGRRVRSMNSTGHAIYSLYAQSGQLLFQRDERSNQRRQYVYLGGSLVAESDVPLAGGAATVTYQHTDALGSPVATTNSAKAVLQRSEYEPYGYLLNRPMQDGPGYTGHVTDAATGLVYMQQRYYDPELGMFPSTDPVTPFSPGGAFNRYWYANANPYGFIDPDGRQAQTGQSCGEQPCPNPPQDSKPSRREQYEQRHREQTEALGGEVIVFDPPALPQGLVDGVAGFGDTLSFGASQWARDQLGIGSVDSDSGAYTAGEIGGVLYSTALGGAGGLRAAGSAGRGLEFSHWIPNRFGGPRNLLNGNFVSAAKHALSDPYRYRFMPRAWKAMNPMPSRIVQQWLRIPYFWKGTAAGAAYGAASAGGN